MKTFSILICFFSLTISEVSSASESIKLIYFYFPPYAEAINGRAQGAAIDLLVNLTSGLPVEISTEPYPLKRLEHKLITERSIAIFLGRTPRREELPVVWVSELFSEHFHIFTRAGQNGIDHIDEARRLRRIACNLGGAPCDYLRSLGFTNLEYARDLRSEAAKLHAGRVDGWIEMGPVVKAVWLEAGYDKNELQVSPSFGSQSMWIVASPLIEREVIESIRQRLGKMRQEGQLSELFSDGK